MTCLQCAVFSILTNQRCASPPCTTCAELWRRRWAPPSATLPNPGTLTLSSVVPEDGRPGCLRTRRPLSPLSAACSTPHSCVLDLVAQTPAMNSSSCKRRR
ncbi:hypothetical protein NP493_150g02063 [Ridgeia piscesae]|uniref:Uncharacterized protein n=1 Tax=Ridgeia piscesae TaxID=27915 RepID=A0AAD9P4P8_RIDPI|nr:hypothetical protein NP493_150g02063 [Ridgeia piscesae]